MPITLQALLVVAVTIAFALAGRAVLGRFIQPDSVAESEPTAEVTMEAMAGLYGVLVAFILAGTWDRFDQVRVTTTLEASAFSDLQQIARILPPSVRDEFGSAVEAYRESALEELPLLAEGRSSEEADAVIDRLWRILGDFQPETLGDAELRVRAFDAVEELEKQRRIRLHTVSRQLPTILWVILVGGAVAVICLVAASSLGGRLPAVYLALISAVIGLALYAIYALSYPVRSGLIVEMTPILEDIIAYPPGRR